MDWQKLFNSALYFLYAMVAQTAVVLALLKPDEIPTGWRPWLIVLAGAFVAANGKLTSSTRMSPIGYSRLPPSEDERRAAAGQSPKRLP